MYIKLRVTTKARSELVERITDDHYKVSVKEPPEMNRANTRILEIFRALFPHSQVKMISGHHSPSKILSIEPAEV